MRTGKLDHLGQEGSQFSINHLEDEERRNRVGDKEEEGKNGRENMVSNNKEAHTIHVCDVRYRSGCQQPQQTDANVMF